MLCGVIDKRSGYYTGSRGWLSITSVYQSPFLVETPRTGSKGLKYAGWKEEDQAIKLPTLFGREIWLELSAEQ